MDRMQAPPRGAFFGLLSDLASGTVGYMQDPRRTQQLQGLGAMLESTRIPSLLEGLSYGDSMTTGSGMTMRPNEDVRGLIELATAFAPAGKPAAAAAKAGTMALGRAGADYAERVVPQVMERGGLPAQLLTDLAQGSRSKMFIGPEAKTWDQKAAIKAANMERKGATPQEIWSETGTARGPDKMWRQEISDKDAQISQARLPTTYIEGAGDVPAWNVGQVLNHPALMAAYPDIAKIESSFFNDPTDSARAMLRPGKEMKDSWLSYAESAYKRPFITKRQQDSIDKAKKEYQDFISDPKFKEYDAKIEQAFTENKPIDDLLDLEMESKRNKLSDNYFGLMRTINSGDSPSGSVLGAGQSAKSSTMHELQHAIQEQERFGVGGNTRDFELMRKQADAKIGDMNKQMSALVRQMDSPETTAAQKTALQAQYNDLLNQRSQLVPMSQLDPMEAYGHLMGEAEARLTQRRLNLTPEERRQNFPFQYTGDTGFGFDVDPTRMILMTPEGSILERGLLGNIGR